MWLSLVYDNHNVKTYEYRLIVNSSYPENRSELVYSSAKWLAPKYFIPWLMPLSRWFRELHEVGVSLFRDSLFVGPPLPPGLPLCAQGPIASTLAMARSAHNGGEGRGMSNKASG